MIITRTYCRSHANTLSLSTAPGKKVLPAPCRERRAAPGVTCGPGPRAPRGGLGWRPHLPKPAPGSDLRKPACKAPELTSLSQPRTLQRHLEASPLLGGELLRRLGLRSDQSPPRLHAKC